MVTVAPPHLVRCNCHGGSLNGRTLFCRFEGDFSIPLSIMITTKELKHSTKLLSSLPLPGLHNDCNDQNEVAQSLGQRLDLLCFAAVADANTTLMIKSGLRRSKIVSNFSWNSSLV